MFGFGTAVLDANAYHCISYCGMGIGYVVCGMWNGYRVCGMWNGYRVSGIVTARGYAISHLLLLCSVLLLLHLTTSNDQANVMSEDIQDLIESKNLNAPRVKPADLDYAIDPLCAPQYHVFPGTTVTVCCLRTRNGYQLVGKAAAASEENFDAEIGRKVAYKDAKEQLWPLLGYALCEHIAMSPVTLEQA